VFVVAGLELVYRRIKESVDGVLDDAAQFGGREESSGSSG
jgi:hypothetical protein